MAEKIIINTASSIEVTKNKFMNLFKRCVIKQKKFSEYIDTSRMKSEYGKFKNAYYEIDKIEHYELSENDVKGILPRNPDNPALIDETILLAVLNDHSLIYKHASEEDINALLKLKRTQLIQAYDEPNSYYRMIMGIPEIEDKDEFYIKFNSTEVGVLPPIIDRENMKAVVYYGVSGELPGVDSSKAIHTMSKYELGYLYDDGILTELYKAFPDKKYINYLHRRCNLFEARDGHQFDIIKMGSIDNFKIMDSFKNNYNRNKFIFIRRHHNEFYQNFTEYYEQMMLMILIWATMIDVIRDLHLGPDINFFSEEDIKAVFADNSVELYDELPLSIKSEIANNINILIKTAGTDRVLVNLSKIFNVNNIYNYVLQKYQTKHGPKLRAIPVPVNDKKNLKKYLTQPDIGISLKELTEDDPTWVDKPTSTGDKNYVFTNNEFLYKNIETRLLEKDFSYIYTKYVTLDNVIVMSQLTLDMSMFFNYMKRYDEISGLNNPTGSFVQIRHQLAGTWTTLFDLYCYLCACTLTKWKFSDDIPKHAAEVAYVIGLNDKLSFKTEEFPNIYDDIDLIDLIHLFEREFAGMGNMANGAYKEYSDFKYIIRDWLTYNKDPLSSKKTFYNFINAFYKDRKLIADLNKIIRTTYDKSTYYLAKRILNLCTTLESQDSVYGGFDTYSELLKFKNITLYKRFAKLKNNEEEIYYSEFDSEISYVLMLFGNLIDSLNNDDFSETFKFFEDIRDTEYAEIKNILGKLITYFSSLTVTVKDPTLIYELGDVLDSFRPREDMKYEIDNYRQSQFDSPGESLIFERNNPPINEQIIIKEELIWWLHKGFEYTTENTTKREVRKWMKE